MKWSSVFCSIIALSFFYCEKEPSSPDNLNPVISLSLKSETTQSFNPLENIEILLKIDDDDALDSLEVNWFAKTGAFVQTSKTDAIWQASPVPGSHKIFVEVTDPENNTSSDSLVVPVGNRPPILQQIAPKTAAVVLGNEMHFSITASDSDNHDLQLNWSASAGTIISQMQDSIIWKAPLEPTEAMVIAKVTDAYNASDSDTAKITVYREAGTAWIGDTGNGRVVKLSAEGEIIFENTDFVTPTSIKIDAIRRAGWVLDFSARTLTKISFTGTTQAILEALGGPLDLDILKVNGHVWVVESDSNQVIEVSNDGQSIVRTIRGFRHPSAIGIDQRTAGIYVADTGNHQILLIDSAVPNLYNVSTQSGSHQVFSGFDSPIALDVALHSQEVWIVDQFLETVSTIHNEETLTINVSGLRLPRSVAIDNTTRTAWIADTGNGRVLKINQDGIVSQVTGFLLPHDIAVDPNDGSLWVADTENDRIVKCEPDGQIIFSIYGFNSPQGITINPGQ